MSLTSFLNIPEVAERVKPLRPKLPRQIAAPLRVEPRSSRYALVGTAFDYLLRFEMQRRAPHAIAREWVAEGALALLGGEITTRDNRTVMVYRELLPGVPADYVYECASAVVEAAKAAVAAHLKMPQPLDALAAHAIRLAKLDSAFRAARLDLHFEDADPEDVEDLLAMLDLVPFDSMVHEETLWLNPTFGQSSMIVGGADADLITGDLLIDFKATKKTEMSGKDLDQLLGYYLLACRQRRLYLEFPVIKRVGLYFSRHGYLWTMDVDTWTSHPNFKEIEEWFFKRAERKEEMK